MTADVQRVLDDARAVFLRLDDDATRHLEQSWRGRAGQRALEALRRYISEALDGLAGRAALPGIAMPTAADLAPPGIAVGTVPAGAGGVPPVATAPIANHRNGLDEYGSAEPTHTAAIPPAAHLPVTTSRTMPTAESPLPAASFSATTGPPVPSSAPPQSTAPGGQSRTAFPYTPMMGAGYPGGMVGDNASSRRTPGYLISIDNGNELIGPLPKVTPPVIGGE